jgi:hypothetical protein
LFLLDIATSKRTDIAMGVPAEPTATDGTGLDRIARHEFTLLPNSAPDIVALTLAHIFPQSSPIAIDINASLI